MKKLYTRLTPEDLLALAKASDDPTGKLYGLMAAMHQYICSSRGRSVFFGWSPLGLAMEALTLPFESADENGDSVVDVPDGP